VLPTIVATEKAVGNAIAVIAAALLPSAVLGLPAAGAMLLPRATLLSLLCVLLFTCALQLCMLRPLRRLRCVSVGALRLGMLLLRMLLWLLVQALLLLLRVPLLLRVLFLLLAWLVPVLRLLLLLTILLFAPGLLFLLAVVFALLIVLCVAQNGSEKHEEQTCCLDSSKFFHECHLSYNHNVNAGSAPRLQINYSLAASAVACAFAPLTAFRNVSAAAGAATLPSSTERVVT
jgi:hypothetical protein